MMSKMVVVRVSELIGASLDWAVASAAGVPVVVLAKSNNEEKWQVQRSGYPHGPYWPSADWAQGGPLIESGELTVEPSAWDWKGACVLWRATVEGESVYFEHVNLLVAAMRAAVHAKLGDTVSVPKELLS